MKVLESRSILFLIVGLLLSVTLFSVIGCSSFLAEDVKIVGVVFLSDNPPSGHGGVVVSNGYISTTSRFDGAFVLKGRILGDASFTVTFTKPGYNGASYDVKVDYASDKKPTESGVDNFIDLGKVNLTKITP